MSHDAHVTVRIDEALLNRLQDVRAKANAAMAARTPGVRELSLSDIIRGMLLAGVERAERGDEDG